MQHELIRLATIDPLDRTVQSPRLLRAARRKLARASRRLTAACRPSSSISTISSTSTIPTGMRRATRPSASAPAPHAWNEAVTGRLGGDEFALLLETQASAASDRDRRGVAPEAGGAPVRYRQGPYHADLERRRRRGAAGRHRGSDSGPRRCRALRRQARRTQSRGRRPCRSADAAGHRHQRATPAPSPSDQSSLARFFRFSSSRGMISTNEQGRWRLSSWDLRMPSQASRQAPGEPGTQKI